MNDNNFYSEYSESKSRSRYKAEAITDTNIAFVKAYLWMFVGVFITFVTGLISTNLLKSLIISEDGTGLSIFLFVCIFSLVAQFILCFTINKNALRKTNFLKASTGLIVFSILNGITFASLFLFFDASVLCQVFGAVTIYFFILTVLSFLLRNKIHKAASFAWVGLITLLITSVLVSIYSLLFFNSNSGISMQLYLSLNILGLLVFTILTLVDIRSMYAVVEGSNSKKCAAISAAFTLYLDFINIFVYILKILLIIGKNVKKK